MRALFSLSGIRTALLFAVVLLSACEIFAQSDVPSDQVDSPTPSGERAVTVFPHAEKTRYWISGQANIVFQSHGPFHSPYEGANSLQGRGEYKTSLVGTLFLGAQLIRNPRYALDAIVDFESAGGRGISQALGLAGFTNLDVVRNPSLGSKPYLARVVIHQTIGLTNRMTDVERTPFSLSKTMPVRRLEFHVGKMSLPDYIDINTVGSDSHLQYLNWTVDNNGAWDYAADTRGYTYAGVVEYYDRRWAARYAIAAMPTVANGIDLDWAFSRASGQNAEIELHRNFLPILLPSERKGTIRVLAFVNHAHMGLYRDAVKAYLLGEDSTPDISAHAKFGAVKYGFGINGEQEITPALSAFVRLGWNEGQHESYAYTEVDQTLAFGASLRGSHFSRPNDKLGVAFVSNAIKRDHQNYLKYGGRGFLLGDGHLNYAREDILEGFYNLYAWRGLFYAFDAQFIEHPGYNQDRGPVLVEGVRMHVDF